MLSKPQQNDVAERHNHTLLDMVRSMLSNLSLPISLWMHALKTAMYLLNWVPSKAVPKTLFELWIGRKPSLRHMFRVDMQKKGSIIHMKRNWIQEQPMVSSLVVQKSLKGIV